MGFLTGAILLVTLELERTERVQSSAFVELRFSAADFLRIYTWVSAVSVHWRHNTGLERGSTLLRLSALLHIAGT